MKLSRSLILIVAAVILAPAFWIATWPSLSCSKRLKRVRTPPAVAAAPRQAEQVKPKDEKANKPAVMIQGKPLSDWMTALKDRDPAVRLRALEVLGDVTEIRPATSFPSFKSPLTARRPWTKTRVSGKRPRLRSLLQSFPTAESRRQMLEEQSAPSRRRRRRSAWLMPKDSRSLARLSAAFSGGSATARLRSRLPPARIEFVGCARRGVAETRDRRPPRSTAVCAIRQRQGSPADRSEQGRASDIGKPVTIVMYPACRVRLRVECSGFRELETKYHIKLNGSGWWAA